jgi:hypothetical protein
MWSLVATVKPTVAAAINAVVKVRLSDYCI